MRCIRATMWCIRCTVWCIRCTVWCVWGCVVHSGYRLVHSGYTVWCIREASQLKLQNLEPSGESCTLTMGWLSHLHAFLHEGLLKQMARGTGSHGILKQMARGRESRNSPGAQGITESLGRLFGNLCGNPCGNLCGNQLRRNFFAIVCNCILVMRASFVQFCTKTL